MRVVSRCARWARTTRIFPSRRTRRTHSRLPLRRPRPLLHLQTRPRLRLHRRRYNPPLRRRPRPQLRRPRSRPLPLRRNRCLACSRATSPRPPSPHNRRSPHNRPRIRPLLPPSRRLLLRPLPLRLLLLNRPQPEHRRTRFQGSGRRRSDFRAPGRVRCFHAQIPMRRRAAREPGSAAARIFCWVVSTGYGTRRKVNSPESESQMP